MSENDKPQRRRNKFLVVVDDSPEVRSALRFATGRASNVGGGVTLLRVVAPADFSQWAGVGKIMREEAHEEAGKLLNDLAAQVQKNSGIMPELVIREGDTKDELLALISEDPAIRILVLGAAPGKEGPGPLVTALVGEMAGNLAIPVTVVPGNLTDAQIDDLT